jgi:crotonobetainyl-CoA:carnitine CoA-transferase CaiB-like acyl-CoA transferase
MSHADIVVTNSADGIDVLRTDHPSLVVVAITPFGCDGPWSNRPGTEFTLQAACGSTGQRGVPEQPPLAAGGRIGEWVAGTYAAVGAVAAYREAVRSGVGEFVDVAMLDCMAVTMVTYPSVFASFGGWPPVKGTGRSVEVPSIEPTTDGFVVLTTNSAQQFQDFLVMIGRPDLVDDPDLPQAAKRFSRRDEFLKYVRDYTTQRTTNEVLDEASLYRIPAGPVLAGSNIPEFEQFVARQVFCPAPSGRFSQPRVPYSISGTESRPFGPAPTKGQHTGRIKWHRRAPSGAEPGSSNGWRLPLTGVRVVDCTAWWAGPAATSVLASLGADVIKVESVTRPDPMRFASTRPPTEDQWWEWGPVFHSVNTNKKGITLDLTRPEGRAIFEQLVSSADVLVENYTPRVMEQFGLGWDHLHATNSELTMVRMPAFGLDGPWRDRTGFAQTMECLTGMAWLTGFADGPPVLVRGACDPLAGMHAVFATLLAIIERDRSGGGRLVETVMVEAALNAAAEQIVEYGAAGTILRRDGNRGPVAAPQGVYRCGGDDRWVALAVVTDWQWRTLRRLLGEPSWSIDPSLDDASGRRRMHDLIDDELSAWAAGQDAKEVSSRLCSEGIPCEVVTRPRDIASNPQLQARSLFELVHHPVTGDHEVPVLPLRFGRVGSWIRSPAPTLGQHNEEILGDLGLQGTDIEQLRHKGIVGERLAGA